MTNARPTISMEMLKIRHELLRRTRAFFDNCGFLEVTTPLLSSESFADPYIDPFSVPLPEPQKSGFGATTLYLQTSPELGMKRLLAAGVPCLYQITQAFRIGEVGKAHNPEFTILEWYRAGDDYGSGRRLLIEYLSTVLTRIKNVVDVSYADVFQAATSLNPHTASTDELQRCAQRHGLATLVDRGDLIDGLMALVVEPTIDPNDLVVIYDFPRHQAALAQAQMVDGAWGKAEVARRFEAYHGSLELANGYVELLGAGEIEDRHRANSERRAVTGRPQIPLPQKFLDAMRSGMPESVGVALGFDRLVMAASRVDSIDHVLTFPASRA